MLPATVRFSELLAANRLRTLWIKKQTQAFTHLGYDAFRRPSDDFGLACRPVKALDLICKHYPSYWKTFRQLHFKRIALDLIGDRAEQCEVHL